MLHAVIMAGGSGTRFWPASRSHTPKQLLNLVGDQSMLQATVSRLQGLVPTDQISIITNRALVDTIRDQIDTIPPENVVGEPCKRDTAPCVGLAAVLARAADDDATMVVMPSDHVIQPEDVFREALHDAAETVEKSPQTIATFGIPPTYAAESFGYIERGDSIDAAAGSDCYRVKEFHEKPNSEVAEQYLAAGTYFWNSGIFVWKAATILSALENFEPEMFGHLSAIANAIGQDDFQVTLDREFGAINGKSIDFAVMEKYSDVVVFKAPFGWDDVGSWRSLARLRGVDVEGNTVVGNHLGLGSTGCIVRGEDGHLIVTMGMEDCIVVHTADATLVARKKDEESIRKVVELIREQGQEKFL